MIIIGVLTAEVTGCWRMQDQAWLQRWGLYQAVKEQNAWHPDKRYSKGGGGPGGKRKNNICEDVQGQKDSMLKMFPSSLQIKKSQQQLMTFLFQTSL